MTKKLTPEAEFRWEQRAWSDAGGRDGTRGSAGGPPPHFRPDYQRPHPWSTPDRLMEARERWVKRRW